MTEVDWPSVRHMAAGLFGELPPHPEVEDEIVAVFEDFPAEVMQAVSQVGEKVRQGKVRSGWRVLRKECVEIANPRHQASASYGDKRELRVRQAETWIRNAGCYVDRETTIRDVDYGPIFGPGGQLHDWRDDEALIDRIAAFWRAQRPRGAELEQQSEAYMAKLRADHERITSKTSKEAK